MQEACKACDLKQVEKIADILSLSAEQRKSLMKKSASFLSHTDTNRTNPEVLGDLWQLITKEIQTPDPYSQIKQFYNRELLRLSPRLAEVIRRSDDPLHTALKFAICGNLVDFAAKHQFSFSLLEQELAQISSRQLAADDSGQMISRLKSAKELLYLGDNCGEIVLDKLFIQVIRSLCPDLQITYAVRGTPVVNDATLEDARMAGLGTIAISNGDFAPGTILKNTSKEFQKQFESADIVISKGQGNYESLIDCEKQELYFLFLAKCEIIADPLGVPVMGMVCLKNRVSRRPN